MSSYQQLAGAYDELTWDVGYEKRADFLEKLFRRSRIPVHTVLDLACGTGSMTWLLAGRGYELIAVDGSQEMLAAAREKNAPAEVPPLFLHQSMPRLDLYGTVDAAICCLDSLNYLTDPRDVQRTLRRLHLFISPGGLLAFDVRLPERLAALDGQVFLDETEDTYCVWRTEYRRGLCTYYMDLFTLAEDSSTGLGTGGMITKLRAAAIATEAGCEMVIANGSKPEVLYDIAAGRPAGTRFLTGRAAV